MIKKIFVIFLYFLITVYTVEILLYFYIPKEQKILANILPTRVKLAKDKNIKFDTRSKESAFIEESKKNPNLFTSFNYSAAFSTLTLFKEAQKNNELEITNDDHEETQESFGEISFRNLDVFGEYEV